MVRPENSSKWHAKYTWFLNNLLILSCAGTRLEHRFPFSLFSESKRCARECAVIRTGDVSDQMDRAIGRPVIKIRGNVSANNFIEFSGLALTGASSFSCCYIDIVLWFHSDVLKTHVSSPSKINYLTSFHRSMLPLLNSSDCSITDDPWMMWGLSWVKPIFPAGCFVYVQLKVQQQATFHIEIVTTADVVLRLTMSTMYAADRVRYLGSSIRSVRVICCYTVCVVIVIIK